VKDWRVLLAEACERAQTAVSKHTSPAERARIVGTGAAGDRTLAADRDAEREILDSLSEAGPLRVVSEEAGALGDRHASLTAIVDPLDGSSNFSRGIPFYCTSIAIVDGRRMRDVRYAMVRNLVTGEEYYSERGAGSWKDGRAIRTSSARRLSESVVGIDLNGTSEADINRLAPLLSSVKRQVHFGANALELCLLAEGRVDAFVDKRGKMRVTDFAGGYLIAREAGGTLSAPDGKQLAPALDLQARFDYVASANEAIHRAILEKLR